MQFVCQLMFARFKNNNKTSNSEVNYIFSKRFYNLLLPSYFVCYVNVYARTVNLTKENFSKFWQKV